MAKTEHSEIPIPGFNPYSYEKSEKDAHKALACARPHVDKRQLQDIKANLPLKTAHQNVEKTFGKGRLTEPSEGQAKSPLEMVLDLLKPIIKTDGWKEFKKQFRKMLLQQFEIIGWFNYDIDRIKKVNGRINKLINEFTRPGVSVSLNFVPHPETAESFYSERLVELRSKIHCHFTGKPLDVSKLKPPTAPDSPIQMDMHLDLRVTMK